MMRLKDLIRLLTLAVYGIGYPVVVFAGAAPVVPEKLREENIRDEEVREIQRKVNEASPGRLINIAGVMVGCDCGELPACTEQVSVLVNRADSEQVKRLALAKVSDRWDLTETQKWELRFEKFVADYRSKMAAAPARERSKIRTEFLMQRQLMFESQPRCPVPVRTPAQPVRQP